MASASMERALKLAVVTGLRAALGPALVAQAQHRPEQQHLALAALGELVFDKLPFVPEPRHAAVADGPRPGGGVGGRQVRRAGRRERRPVGRAARRGGRDGRRGGRAEGPQVARLDAWDPPAGPRADRGLPRPQARHRGVGLSMDQVSEAAQESVDDLRERFHLDGLDLALGRALSRPAPARCNSRAAPWRCPSAGRGRRRAPGRASARPSPCAWCRPRPGPSGGSARSARPTPCSGWANSLPSSSIT